MRNSTQPDRASSLPIPWLALALILILQGIGLLAVRPDWHQAFHLAQCPSNNPDNTQPESPQDHPDQTCVLEWFASGLVDLPFCDSPILSPASLTFNLPQPVANHLFSSPSHLHPPGRAPPHSLPPALA